MFFIKQRLSYIHRYRSMVPKCMHLAHVPIPLKWGFSFAVYNPCSPSNEPWPDSFNCASKLRKWVSDAQRKILETVVEHPLKKHNNFSRVLGHRPVLQNLGGRGRRNRSQPPPLLTPQPHSKLEAAPSPWKCSFTNTPQH